jgi:hypothetical protein
MNSIVDRPILFKMLRSSSDITYLHVMLDVSFGGRDESCTRLGAHKECPYQTILNSSISDCGYDQPIS